MKKLLFLVSIFFSAQSYSWDYSDKVKIDALFQWETQSIQSAMVVLSNGKMCHIADINADEKLYTLVLSLYMANKTFGIHCYDESEDVGGFNSKRIHRIGAT